VFIQDRMAVAYERCIDALLEADLITIGPGSLFTTVIACLAFSDLSRAICESRAKVVHVCNNTTQPGQTDGFHLADHVQQVMMYVRGRLDYVLLNSRAPSSSLRQAYAQEGVHILLPDDDQLQRIERMGVKPIVRDLAHLTDGKRHLFDKQDSIRHDPSALASALMELLDA
jgi:uncharacterized cofD-like protein